MEYLDELDNSAVQALIELGGSFPHLSPPTLPWPPASTRSSCSTPHRRSRRIQATYILRLEPPLSTPRDLANALNLSRVPNLETGSSEDGAALFCRLTQNEATKLDAWTTRTKPKKRPTKIRLSIAHKDAHELPHLGRDTTLPQHRPDACRGDTFQAHEYPVPYFFYGTLASLERLSRLFDVPACQLGRFERGTLLDGRVRTWAGKYRALVDSPGGRVEGSVFLVNSVEEEEALRVYEGDSYEVVDARIVMDGGREIQGRTFRYCGYGDELTG